MDDAEPVQASLNSSYRPTLFEDGITTDEEDSEDHSPSESLLPKPSLSPLVVRFTPEDSYNLVYVLFFLMGIGSLLPWNFFITAKHYWIYKLSNSSDLGKEGERRSDISDYFESYLSIASTVPSVLCLILNYMLVNRLSPKLRVLSSLWVILLVFVVTTALVKVDVSNSRTDFFIGTLVSVAVVSGASNIFSGSMFGISGYFPMRITQALVSGMGNVLFNLTFSSFLSGC
uniref:Solute carrier family 29 member 3 n=1 Tax=Oryzias latipes TaxID=8090 RepID=A0A3P9IQF3_ORYLA